MWRRRRRVGAYLLGAALALDAACGEHLPQLLDLVGAEAVVEAEVGVEAEAEVEAEAGAAVAFAVAKLVAVVAVAVVVAVVVVVAVAVADLHALAVDRALLLGQRAAEERRGEARAPQLERHFLDTFADESPPIGRFCKFDRKTADAARKPAWFARDPL